MPFADLHAHTTASDGSLSPTDLVALAARQGLAALGVTDHDTTAGLAEAAEVARRTGIRFIPGVELSILHPAHFHLLGYCIRTEDEALTSRLEELRRKRDERNRVMVSRMADLGMDVDLEDVEREAGGEVIGRPHMALALQRKGYVSSTQEAFDRFLARGGPLYVPKAQLTPEEGFALIRRAGGVPTVAHPFSLKLDEDTLEAQLREWMDLGLAGLECYYSMHTEEQTAQYLRLAARLGLVVTGGSDFHGTSKPTIHLGKVHDGLGIPLRLVDELERAAQAVRGGAAPTTPLSEGSRAVPH